MKILSKEEEEAHYNETLKGGALGGLVGLTTGLVLSLAAQRFSPNYRALTIPLKAFGVTALTTAGLILEADRYSRLYEEAKYGKFEERISKNDDIAFSERALEWARSNRYRLVAGVWLGSMVGGGIYINRNKYLTFSQKLVQVRMVAQSTSVLAMLSAAGLATSGAGAKEDPGQDVDISDPQDPKHMIHVHMKHEDYPGQEQWRIAVAEEEERLKKEGKDNKGHLKQEKNKSRTASKGDDAKGGQESPKSDK